MQVGSGVIRDSGSRALLCGVVAAALFAACTTTGEVAKRRAEIEASLNQVRTQAMICKPRELAESEANLVFATDQAAMGQSIRAYVHLEEAERLRQEILAVANKPECELDRDGDGFRDSADACPDDPEDFDGDRDEDGCPDYDRDGDGIDDPVDKCPDDPEDGDGFEDQDGCPDPDNDQDGIADAADKCPMDAEDKDNFEDLDGCPDADNDQDKIPDVTDKCPNQPEDYDGDADEDGCPEEAAAPPPPPPVEYKLIKVTETKIELKQKVYFATAKAKIRQRSFAMLREIADVLRKREKMVVRIEGHTDSQGSSRYNQKLSQRRAEAVRTFLMEAGVPGSRVTAIGYGEDKPIAPNNTAAGREKNRRVEFFIVSQ